MAGSLAGAIAQSSIYPMEVRGHLGPGAGSARRGEGDEQWAVLTLAALAGIRRF